MTRLIRAALYGSTVIYVCCGAPVPRDSGPLHGRPPRSSCERLWPGRSPITDPSTQFGEHDVAVARALFSKAPDDLFENWFILMMMVKEAPSAPQEAVYILESRKGRSGPFRVVHSRLEQSIIFVESNVATKVAESEIDQHVVRAIERVWSRMIQRAQWPAEQNAYEFAIWGGVPIWFDYGGATTIQGHTVSPDPATCPGRLVAIADLLVRFVHVGGPVRRRAVRDEILRTTRELSERLGDE